MRAAYHEALEEARLDVVRLGALVGDAIHAAVVSLEKRDSSLAARVIAGDDDVDTLRRKVEASCIELIWRQQPVAGELRQVSAMLQIVTDLERIGDYAVEISKNSIKLSDVPIRPARVEIGRIASIASEMLRDAMRAYTEGDEPLTDHVIERDDEVDTLYHRGIEALQQEMAADAGVVRAGTIMLFVLTNLERVGDQSMSIAIRTQELLQYPAAELPVDIACMGEHASRMVRLAVQALLDADAQFADSVVVMDDEIDRMNHIARAALMKVMEEQPEISLQALNAIIVARALERIADHATNISRDVIFWIRGADVRHQVSSAVD